MYKGRVYVPKYREIINIMLIEMHNVPYDER
jgi:hypothetical protein